MPASKTKLFSQREQDLSNIGRALSHPARIRILNVLNSKPFTRNKDLIQTLQLSKSSVQNHVKKLEDANLITVYFAMNSFYISKKDGAEEEFKEFLNDLS